MRLCNWVLGLWESEIPVGSEVDAENIGKGVSMLHLDVLENTRIFNVLVDLHDCFTAMFNVSGKTLLYFCF
jgi:hypothetical protein